MVRMYVRMYVCMYVLQFTQLNIRVCTDILSDFHYYSYRCSLKVMFRLSVPLYRWVGVPDSLCGRCGSEKNVCLYLEHNFSFPIVDSLPSQRTG